MKQALLIAATALAAIAALTGCASPSKPTVGTVAAFVRTHAMPACDPVHHDNRCIVVGQQKVRFDGATFTFAQIKNS